MTKSRKILIVCLAMTILIFGITPLILRLTGTWVLPGERAAVRRAKAFAFEVNYHYRQPQRAYPFLTQAYRHQMTEEEFTQAFHKERRYPYLTPFFIDFESITMEPGHRTGVAVFSQAARLPGMKFHLPIVYERGNYYVEAFNEFLDGSYLKKFDR